MSLFGFTFGADVEVSRQGFVTVSGIRFNNLQSFIQKYYNSPTFLNRFVERNWSNSIIIHQWYVPELIFLLTKAIEERYLSPIQTKNVIELLYKNTWMKSTLEPVQSIVDLNVIKTDFINNFQLKDYQLEFIRDTYYQKKTQYHLNGYLLSLSQGLGKGCPHGTKIRCPNGWTTIENLHVGDTVIAVDGTPSTITGVYPQGVEDIYRVTFEDGRYLDTDEHHLWTILVKDANNKYTETDISTKDLLVHMQDAAVKDTTYIPMITPESGQDINLPIDPYTLGVILESGYINNGDICIRTILSTINLLIYLNKNLKISLLKNDDTPTTYTASIYTSENYAILNALSDLKVVDDTNIYKFIPKMYLNASYKQRLELLQGIMSAHNFIDGHTSTNDKYTIMYHTEFKQLAYDIRELILSLSGKCTILENRHNDTTIYELLISFKSSDIVFGRNNTQQQTIHYRNHNDWNLRILSVDKLNEQKECTCIAIDHPSKLFVAKDYIVTHNTLTSLVLSSTLHKKHTVVICPLSVVNNVWVNEINKWYKKQQNIWTPIKDPMLINKSTDFVIANYEAIDKIYPSILKHFTPENTFIIVDESHNFKDIKAQRTKQLFRLINDFHSTDTLLLSGTPLKAFSSEAVPIFKFLDPMLTPDIEADLLKLNRFTMVINDLMRNRLGMMMYRKLKEEVLTLPEKHESDLLVKIPNGDYYTLDNVKKIVIEFTEDRRKYYKKHYSEYETMYNNCLKEFESTLRTREEWIEYKQYKANVVKIQKNGYSYSMMPVVVETNQYEKEVIIPRLPVHMRADFRSSKATVKYVELKILGEVLGRLLNTLRTEMTADLIGKEVIDIIKNAEKKTILFSSYVESINIADEVCRKNGLMPTIITGENTKQAAHILEVFKRDPKLNPLIASIKAMSTGHTITEANTVIFLNVPFRSVDYEQASDRVYRIGQDCPVYIYKLVLDTGATPNLSTRMQDIIAWSKESFDTIVGDGIEDPTIDTSTINKISEAFKSIISNGPNTHTHLITYQTLIDGVINTLRKLLK